MPFLVPLFAAILPFLLFPLEIILPYPFLVEEAAKTLLLIPILRGDISNREKIILAVISGGAFALSESVLYLFNIYLIGDIGTLLLRSAITIPFHSLTMLVILMPGLYKKPYIIFGLLTSVILHFLFNYLISAV
jgi:RsiW-degrading membrane proteinase PrsW (M82 family)